MLASINKIKQYVIKIKSTSPLRIGNGDERGNGLLLYNNHAVINGTTFSGIFRDCLKNIKGSEEEYKLIFPNNDEEKNISNIFFYDSISDKKITINDLCCRNHIKIDEELGSAEKNHLFNEWHIAEGKTFTVVFEIRGLDLDEKLYNNLCKHIEQFINRISRGEISIGSKSSFGFGKFQLIEYEDDLEKNVYYYKEYNLSNKNDLDSYLEFNIDSLNIKEFNEKDINDITDETRIEVKLQAYCDEGFIIKCQEKLDNENRIMYEAYSEAFNEKDRYIIPSSTIKGIVRGYSNKIYKSLNKEDKQDIENIFGTKTDEEGTGSKGTIVFNDCKIDRCKTETYNRIKIDRFTGGTIGGSLFKENLVIVEENNPIEFNVSIVKNDKKAIALTVLALRDIGLGYVTLGSGNNVGYGRFKGKSITISGLLDNELKIEFESSKLTGNLEELNKIISILKE